MFLSHIKTKTHYLSVFKRKTLIFKKISSPLNRSYIPAPIDSPSCHTYKKAHFLPRDPFCPTHVCTTLSTNMTSELFHLRAPLLTLYYHVFLVVAAAVKPYSWPDAHTFQMMFNNAPYPLKIQFASSYEICNANSFSG